MNKRILPKELISLIHHLKLNEVGWWDRGIQRLILAVFWLEKKELCILNIADLLYTNFNLEIESDRLKMQVSALLDNKELIETGIDKFKITEESNVSFTNSIIESEKIEETAKEYFFKLSNEKCPSLDQAKTWVSFNENLLNPLVKSLGAKTYELISGKLSHPLNSPLYNKYIEKYPIEIQISLRELIIGFLDPRLDFIRAYVLGLLNTYFFIEAGNLTKNAIDELIRISNQKITFTVFVDSNFLFSILDLHENPSNEAARSLLNLIESVKDKVNLKLYVIPFTIDEIKRVLIKHEVALKNIRLFRNIVNVADESNISGFKKKYFDFVKKTKEYIKPSDYFGPFINNLVTILKSKRVELFNENFDRYKTKQEVVDDILEQLRYEEGKENAKDYAQLEHDIVLWYITKDKRPSVTDSPKDANYWIVTIDFRFLGFDAFKGKTTPNYVPLCVHPTTLMQILQFWIPRNNDFEEAMLGNIRLPLLFSSFDSNAEYITLNILSTISRFENVENLTEETITNIVFNDTLRQKINSTRDINKQIDLIKVTLVEENAKIQIAKESISEELKNKEEKLKEREDEINNLKEKLKRSKESKNLDEKNLKILSERIDRLEKEKAALYNLESALSNYEKKKNLFIDVEWKRFSEDKNYFWQFLISFCIIFIIIILLCLYLPDNQLKWIPVGIFLATLILSFFNKDKIFTSIKLFFKLKKFKTRKLIEFAEEFEIENKKPKLEDFLK